MIDTFVELAAGITGLIVALWIFFNRSEYARRTKERLDRLPKRLGETTARDSTPRTSASISAFMMALSIWLIFDAARRLLIGWVLETSRGRLTTRSAIGR